MEVKLVIASGKNAGQVVPVKGGRFLIGRAKDCHLRPNTDLVSRHHCVVTVEGGFVTIRDLGSHNGTFVNGERLRREEELNNDDKIAVGPLEFIVELSVEMAEQKKPEVENAQEAAARTAEFSSKDPSKDGGEFDLSDWLGDEIDAVHDTRAADQTFAGTASFSKDQDTTPTEVTPTERAPEGQEKTKRRTREPGRLPSGLKRPKAADSKTAAADTLRDFFHRR